MKQLTTDYHMHTTYSWDAHSSVDQMCRRAAKMGMSEIALTDHMEWFPRTQGYERADKLQREIAKCRKRYDVTIYWGVELGNPHKFMEKAKPFVESWPFDVRIGSIHWLYERNIHDGSVFKRRDVHNVIDDYFADMERMVREFDLDMVAHFDRIFFRATLMGLDYDVFVCEANVRSVFEAMIERDLILEVNSKFISGQLQWNDTLRTMLKWYREQGGTQIAVNSDAHRADQIGRNFPVAKSMLTQLGFESVTKLRSRNSSD